MNLWDREIVGEENLFHPCATLVNVIFLLISLPPSSQRIVVVVVIVVVFASGRLFRDWKRERERETRRNFYSSLSEKRSIKGKRKIVGEDMKK